MADRFVRARRYREIVTVFARHGFGLLLERLGIYRYLKMKSSDAGAAMNNAGASAGKRLKAALEELGPAFVKLGQILSTRSDILPADVIAELQKLQDSVKPFPFSEARRLIEAEFEDRLENVYLEFEEEPVAAASISQVYRAKLTSGKPVAVKVQRPGIGKTIDLDLDILKDLARLIDHTSYGELYDCSGVVAEFENTIKNELDFTKEGKNADIFRKNFTRDQGVAVPGVRWIYTTERVLTMEYVEGIRIDDLEALDLAGIDRRKLAEKLAASVCNQILRDGFFHADPHPGNIRAMPDGTIMFLDFGMVGSLSEPQRKTISDFFVGVTTRDSGMVARAIIEMEAAPSRVNRKSFERDIDQIIEKYLSMPMSEIRIDQLIREIFQIAFANHIKIPREFALLSKTLGTLQGLLEKLDPQLDSLAVAKPIAKKLIIQSFSPEKIGGRAKKDLWKYGELLHMLPSAMLNFLTKMEEEDFTVSFEMKEEDKIRKQMEKVSNRITFSVMLLAISIILAGVLVASALSAGASGEMYRLNLLVLKSEFAVELVIVLGLIVSMFRSRK